MVKNILDIDSDFEEGKSKNIVLWNKETLRNWLLNLFTSSSEYENFLGDRPYEPTYGANLTRYLFEPVDEFTALNIHDSLFDAINTFIPELYIQRNSIIVRADDSLPGFKIGIAYYYNSLIDTLEFSVKSKVS